MNLPNKLTVARVVMVPFFILAYVMQIYSVSLLLFVLASITDTLDGRIARSRGLVTNFGKIMDPLADKILVYSALCLFVQDEIIGAWTLIIILAREFIVAGMRTVAASEGKVLAAGVSGKIKTVLQMIAVPIYLLALYLPDYRFIMVCGHIMFYASLVMTVYSGTEYVIKNRDVFSM